MREALKRKTYPVRLRCLLDFGLTFHLNMNSVQVLISVFNHLYHSLLSVLNASFPVTLACQHHDGKHFYEDTTTWILPCQSNESAEILLNIIKLYYISASNTQTVPGCCCTACHYWQWHDKYCYNVVFMFCSPNMLTGYRHVIRLQTYTHLSWSAES